MAAISLVHARILGESNGSSIGIGLVSGIICATLATFATPWLSLLVVVLLGATSHWEFMQMRKASESASPEGAAAPGANATARPTPHDDSGGSTEQ